jgi:hypothetical protein
MLNALDLDRISWRAFVNIINKFHKTKEFLHQLNNHPLLEEAPIPQFNLVTCSI